MKRTFQYIYIIVFILMCLAPAGGFAYNYYENDVSQMNIEKTAKLDFPQIYSDGKINTDFDDEFEAWLNQNIPYRALILTQINAVLGEAMKNPTSNVIIGSEGWIYSVETTDDYMDVDAMSEADIRNMVTTLSLIQERIEGQGGRFLFVPVPNKSSIYPEYMPARFIRAQDSNMDRLYVKLEESGVNYTDLKSELIDSKQNNPQVKLYYRRDTHWNVFGALAGYTGILEGLGREPKEYDVSEYSVQNTRRGDLDILLYPAGNSMEEDYYLEEGIDYDSFIFTYPEGITDTQAQLENFMSDREDHDNNFSTRKLESDQGSSLYMIRDSFGRALLPFMIEAYDETTFVRTATPAIEKIGAASDVVYEICERNLCNVIESAPFMYAPQRNLSKKTEQPASDCNGCFYEDEGYAYRIYGTIDAHMVGMDGRIFVELSNDSANERLIFEAFPIYEKALMEQHIKADRDSDEHRLQGYSLYISSNVLRQSEYEVRLISGEKVSSIVGKIQSQAEAGADATQVQETRNNPYPEENAAHQLSYRGVSICIGDNINALKGSLGNQAAPSEVVYSCLSGTDAEIYYYPNITIETDMDGYIYYISLMDNSYTDGEENAITASGITLGSDRKLIWDKVGNPSRENDRNCVFKTEHMTVTYAYKSEQVTSVILEDNKYKSSEAEAEELDADEKKGVEYSSGNTYLYDETHLMQTGWQIIDGDYYFFDRSTGERIVGQTIDGISIGIDGEVSLSEYEKNKIETMMKAHRIAQEITLPSDTIEEKRRKVFDWIMSFPYHRYRSIKDVYQEEGIEIIEANDIFEEGAGDCVSESAALAFLFHEIGYNDVYWVHDTGHSWVRCGDRLFDPLFAESRNFEANYDAPFTDYRASMAHSMLIY